MNKIKTFRLILAFLTVLAAGAFLGGCGNENRKSTSPATGTAVSPATPPAHLRSCTTCHTVATADWLGSKHANVAPAGDLNGPGDPGLADIAGCAKNCHDPGDDGADPANFVAGYTGDTVRPVVGCEACHGPGSLHAGAGGMGPISLSSNTAGTSFGAVSVSGQFVMCTGCHDLLNSSATGTATAAHDAGGSDPRVVPAVANAFSLMNTNANSITDTHFARPSSWDGNGLNTHNIPSDFIAVTGYALDYADDKVCSNCHNPHKNATINREWTLSAHADPQGAGDDPSTGKPLGSGFFSSAWSHYNWSCNGTDVTACGGTAESPGDRRKCQRCHTTSGFIAYADALRTGNAATADSIRNGEIALLPYTAAFKPELLKCNGCHTDNRGHLRNPGPITAIYDYVSGDETYAQSSHTYPDLAGSNVCMTCHTGRESGDTIKNLVLSGPTLTSFLNLSFVNSHYLTAGGTIFRVTGYTYGDRNYENIGIYRHDKIGTPEAPGTGTNGPCIGCHMSRPDKNGDHLFLPVSRVQSGETVTITGIASEVCFKCHGPIGSLMLDLVREQRELLASSLEALKDRLEKRGYFFAGAHPYFYTLRGSGLASVTTGSAVVTLASGTFPDTIAGAPSTPVKDRFRVNGDGFYYAVKSRDSAVQITLQAPYTGPTATNAEFTLIGDGVKSWTTATGPAPFALPDTDATGSVSGKNNMGAAFNLNLLEHDPGAYAHNRYYVKRLIYDSIDWLDDNQLNYSAGATLTAACEASPQPWCGGATTYLLPNGVMNGTAAERP